MLKYIILFLLLFSIDKQEEGNKHTFTFNSRQECGGSQEEWTE